MRILRWLDNHRFWEIIVNFLVIVGIASVVPLLFFGTSALFFVAMGGFPLWVWLFPTVLSVIWYVYFFMGID